MCIKSGSVPISNVICHFYIERHVRNDVKHFFKCECSYAGIPPTVRPCKITDQYGLISVFEMKRNGYIGSFVNESIVVTYIRYINLCAGFRNAVYDK